MCLIIDEEKTNEIKKLNPNKRVKFWKIVTLVENLKGKSVLGSPFFQYTIKVGVNIPKDKICKYDYVINGGVFHAYTSFHHILFFDKRYEFIIPVYSYVKDIKAFGNSGDVCIRRMEVKLSDYKKAMKILEGKQRNIL